MKTTTRTAGRVLSIACAGSAAAMLMLASIAAVCVAPVARAEPAALTSADFAGRWVSQQANLTLDLSRCGTDWCGVIVSNNACGHTAFRAKEDSAVPAQEFLELTGRLQLAANTVAYGVRATLTRNDSGTATLFIAGHSGGAFSAMRRTYDYRNQMVRGGDATCSPEPKSS